MNAKRKPIFSDKLLKALVASGVITIAAVNPFFGVLAAHVAREELRKRKWRRFKDDLYYLKRRGFISMARNSDGSYRVKSTVAGRQQAAKYKLDDIFIKTPKKWDKCWRLVIFDIPTTKQKARLALLAKLKGLGFIMLQKSVWVHPFECHNEIIVLAKAFGVSRHIQQLTCNKVSAGEYLQGEFEKRNNTKLL